MGYWIEVHCDIRSDGPRDPCRLVPFCATNRNENPVGRGRSAQKAARAVEVEAKAIGWLKRPTQWVCPNCRKELVRQATAKSIVAARANAAAMRKSPPVPESI